MGPFDWPTDVSHRSDPGAGPGWPPVLSRQSSHDQREWTQVASTYLTPTVRAGIRTGIQRAAEWGCCFEPNSAESDQDINTIAWTAAYVARSSRPPNRGVGWWTHYCVSTVVAAEIRDEYFQTHPRASGERHPMESLDDRTVYAPDGQAPSLEQRLDRITLDIALVALSEREQRIFAARCRGMSHDEIAAREGISPERSCQIHGEVMEKLAQACAY